MEELASGVLCIAEERHFLIAYKPPNMPVQADSSHDKDMLTLLKEHIKERDAKPGNVYLGLLHRIDRPAQGLLVFAKTSKAAGRLSASMRAGEWEKEYLAVARGDMRLFHSCGLQNIKTEKEILWSDWIAKDENTHSMRIVCPGETPGMREHARAQEARLAWVCAGYSAGLSLVRIRLITGRKHQIRAQFSARGFPLWGDQRYDTEHSTPGMQLALFAARVSFPHPISGERCSYAHPMPKGEPWCVF